MFSNNSGLFDEKVLFVYNHEAMYKIFDHLILISVIDAIVYKITSKKMIKPLDSLVRTTKLQLISNKRKIDSDNGVLLYKDHLKTVFDCYVESGVFNEISKTKEGRKEKIRYNLPTQLSSFLGKYTVPPRVSKPDYLNPSNFNECLISPAPNSMEITSGEKLIKSLNISNSKRFAVNEIYLNILESVTNDPRFSKLNTPICSTTELQEIEAEVEGYILPFNVVSKELVNKLQITLQNNRLLLKTPFQFRYVTDVTVAEARGHKKKYMLEQDIAEKALNLKSGLTRLTLARLLVGFPMYYTNKLCTTTRQFAHEYLLSRHIGCLKLLRCEYSPKQVTKNGLKSMIMAYYCDDIPLQKKFEAYLLKNSSTNKSMEKFYLENRIDYEKKEALTHFMMLSSELQYVLKHKRTPILLQIDQVASGLVFMSILFRNEALGKQCFVLENNECMGAYTFARQHFEEFYNEEIEEKNEDVLKMCLTDRNLHKYALMCYSYRQTNYGRSKDFIARWKEINKKDPTKEEWRCLNEVAAKYSNYVDTLFPGIDTQIKILDNIIDLVVKNSGSLEIRTLEGEVLEWSFYKTKSSVRKSLSPNTLKTKSYRIHTVIQDNERKPIPDHNQFKTKFLSYLVHSLDAGVMRKLVLVLNDNHKCKIDQLHDCIMVHPNKVDSVYESLESIYSDPRLKNYMNDNVFNMFLNKISDTKRAELKRLIDQFNSHNDKIFDKNLTVDIHKMYTFEA